MRYTDMYRHMLKLQLAGLTLEGGGRLDARNGFAEMYRGCSALLAPGAVPVPEGAGDGERMEEFRRTVAAWFTLDDEEKVIRAKLQDLRKELVRKTQYKAQFSESIKSFMEQHRIDNVNTREGMLSFVRRDVMKQPTRNELVERIRGSVTETVADEIMRKSAGQSQTLRRRASEGIS
jgi:hypothetical protein